MNYIITLAAVLCAVFAKKNPELDLEYKNNFYILLSSSKFYFNYRHSSNVLIFYKYLKERGITDDRILLMLPENHACNARNPMKGQIYMKTDHSENFYCNEIEIDYKSDDLTYEAILNLFRGRYDPNFPESKKLKTNSESKLFIYFNGHGGENFFKIQDTEVLQSEDFAKVYEEMSMKKMYKEVLMFIDTCQAMTLFDGVDSPDLILMGTSVLG